jgi:hypothetical protein
LRDYRALARGLAFGPERLRRPRSGRRRPRRSAAGSCATILPLGVISETEKNYVLQNYPNFTLEGVAFYAWPTSVSGTSPVYRFNVRRVSLLYDLGEREDLRAAELSQFHARRNRVPRTNESVTRTVFKNKTPRWITGALCVMGA